MLGMGGVGKGFSRNGSTQSMDRDDLTPACTRTHRNAIKALGYEVHEITTYVPPFPSFVYPCPVPPMCVFVCHAPTLRMEH